MTENKHYIVVSENNGWRVVRASDNRHIRFLQTEKDAQDLADIFTRVEYPVANKQ